MARMEGWWSGDPLEADDSASAPATQAATWWEDDPVEAPPAKAALRSPMPAFDEMGQPTVPEPPAQVGAIPEPAPFVPQEPPRGEFRKGLDAGVAGAKQMAAAAATIPFVGIDRQSRETLAAFDEIDRGSDAPLRQRRVPTGMADPIGQQARMYYDSPAEERASIRKSVVDTIASNKDFRAGIVDAWKRYGAEAQASQGKTVDFTDIRDLEGFKNWFAYNTGQGIPYLAGSALSGIIGGALGGPAGAAVGVGAAGFGMGVGDIQSELMDKGISDRPDVAIAGAIPYAALDFLGPVGRTLRNLSRPAVEQVARNYFQRLGREIPANLVEEFINEAGQEIVKDAAVTSQTGEKLLTDESLLRWFNSGMAGTASAGPGSVVSAIPGGRPAPQSVPQQETPPDVSRETQGPGQEGGINPAAPATDPAGADLRNREIPQAGQPGQTPDMSAPVRPAPTPEDLQAVLDDPRPVAEIMAERERQATIDAVAAEDGPEVAGAIAKVIDGQGTRTAPLRVETAQDIDAAAAALAVQPTPRQGEAGNYQKIHLKMPNGLDIAIEVPRGGERAGVGPDGRPWSVTMPAHYGYLKAGKDSGDGKVDVFVGDFPEARYAYVIDQIDPATGKFDEPKVMLGMNGEGTAAATYEMSYSDGSGPARMGAITRMTVAELKAWLRDGNPKKPLAYVPGPAIAAPAAADAWASDPIVQPAPAALPNNPPPSSEPRPASTVPLGGQTAAPSSAGFPSPGPMPTTVAPQDPVSQARAFAAQNKIRLSNAEMVDVRELVAEGVDPEEAVEIALTRSGLAMADEIVAATEEAPNEVPTQTEAEPARDPGEVPAQEGRREEPADARAETGRAPQGEQPRGVEPGQAEGRGTDVAVRAETAPSEPLVLRIGDRTYPVQSIEDASRIFVAARDKFGEGASNTPTPIIERDGRAVGYISYNGRVWAGSPQDRSGGKTPIYDPLPPPGKPAEAMTAALPKPEAASPRPKTARERREEKLRQKRDAEINRREAAKRAIQTRKANAGALNIVQTLAAAGGLKDVGGDLRTIMGRPNLMVPVYGALRNEKTGMDPDRAREMLVEAGFLPEGATLNDLYAAIDQTVRGNPVMSARDVNEQIDRAEERKAQKYGDEPRYQVSRAVRSSAPRFGTPVSDEATLSLASAHERSIGSPRVLTDFKRAWSSGATVAESVMAVRRELVGKGLRTGWEFLALSLPENGGLLHGYTIGRKAAVDFTPEVLADIQADGAPLIAQHNHPSGRSLSVADVQSLIAYPRIGIVFAHGHDGSDYAASIQGPIKEYAGSVPLIRREAVAGWVNSARVSADRFLIPLISPMIRSGRLTEKQANAIHLEITQIAIARAGLIEYASTTAAETQRLMPEWRDMLVEMFTSKRGVSTPAEAVILAARREDRVGVGGGALAPLAERAVAYGEDALVRHDRHSRALLDGRGVESLTGRDQGQAQVSATRRDDRGGGDVPARSGGGFDLAPQRNDADQRRLDLAPVAPAQRRDGDRASAETTVGPRFDPGKPQGRLLDPAVEKIDVAQDSISNEQMVIPGAERVAAEGRKAAKAPQRSVAETPLFGGEQAATKEVKKGDAAKERGRQGALFQATQTNTPEFRRWFGDSKVVDEAGAPKVYYHSTTAAGQFDRFKRRQNDIGIHFGTAGQAADRFALKNEKDPYASQLRGVSHGTIPVYLSIKNPLRVRDVGAFNQDNLPYALEGAGFSKDEINTAMRSSRSSSGQIAALRNLIERKGYDGIVYANTGETGGAAPLRKAMWDAWSAKQAARQSSDPQEVAAADQAFNDAYTAYKDFREGNAEDSYIAFRPTQIKSAIGNSGAFDPRNPDIRAQAGDRARLRVAGEIDATVNLTPKDAAQRDAVSNALKVTLRRMLGKAAPDAAVFDSMMVDEQEITGAYSPLNNLLAVSLRSPDPIGTVRHETIHVLRQLGLIDDAAWSALTQAAETGGWLDKHSIDERWGEGLTREQALEEAIAEEFGVGLREGVWKTGDAKADAIFQRIAEFFRRVRSEIKRALAATGLRELSDADVAELVFSLIERGAFREGEITAREAREVVAQETNGDKTAYQMAAAGAQQAANTPQPRRLRTLRAAISALRGGDAVDPLAKVRVPNDIGWARKTTVTPRTIAAYFPAFADAFFAGTRQFQARDMSIFELTEIARPYLDLEQASKDKVAKVIEHGRMAGEVYTAEPNGTIVVENKVGQQVRGKIGGVTLMADGETVTLDAKEVDAYRAYRKVMDRALDKFRDQVVREWGFDPNAADAPKTAEDVDDLARNTENAGERARLKTLSTVLESIETAKRRGYVPFTRYGSHYVTVTSMQDGKFAVVHREHIEPGLTSDPKAFGPLKRLTIPRLEQQAAALRARLAEIYPPRRGFQISELREVTPASFDDIPDFSDLDAIIAAANLPPDQSAAVQQALGEVIQKRGFRAHFIKSRNIPGYCIAPDTKILTDTMEWVEAGSIKVGDKIVGFEEWAQAPKRRRRMDVAAVERVERLTKPCYRLTMRSGRAIVASDNHLFLNMRGGVLGHTRWKSVEDIVVGDRLKTFPQESPKSDFESGWFSGILDGEGWMCRHNGKRNGGLRMGWAQNPGAVLDRSIDVARRAGFTVYRGAPTKSCKAINVSFCPWDAVAALQAYRPSRFISERKWVGAPLPTAKEADTVVSKEYVGEVEVVGIKTTSHTFIANGFASHNSSDFERSLADYIVGISGYLARREHLPEIEDAIASIPATQPELRRYAKDWNDYIQNPSEEWNGLRQAGFLWYLSGRLSSALVNLSQVPMVTAPYLSMFASPVQASAEIARAYKDAGLAIRPKPKSMGGAGLDFFDPDALPADVREAVKKAIADGTLLPIETFQEMARAQGKTPKSRSIGAKAKTAQDAAAFMFQAAERTNRLVSFIAAYRLAQRPEVMGRIRSDMRDNPLWTRRTKERRQDAATFAAFVVEETQFLLGKINRTKMMRGPGSVIFQFKAFAANYIELMARLGAFGSGVHRGGRNYAALAGMAFALFMVGGLLGLPGAEDGLEMIEALIQSMTGVDPQLERGLRETAGSLAAWAARQLGAGEEAQDTVSRFTGRVVARGVAREAGVDVSQRIGQGRFVPKPTGTEHDSYWYRTIGLAGIPGSWVLRGIDAASALARGDLLQAGIRLAPEAIADIGRASQLATDGVRTIAKGRQVMRPDETLPDGTTVGGAANVAKRALGFQPTGISRAREQMNAVRRAGEAPRDLFSDFNLRRANIQAALNRADEAVAAAKTPAAREAAQSAVRREAARMKRVMGEIEAYNASAPFERQYKLQNPGYAQQLKTANQGQRTTQIKKVPMRVRGSVEDIESRF